VAVPAVEDLPPEIRALGAFAVRRGGRTVPLPPGRPELLVKLLVARGGRAHAEEAIEALWPDVAPASGRKRLRNALSRLRAAAGDLVVRDGEALAIVPEAEVDAIGFEADARAALAAPDPASRAALARAAAARYAGDLLPGDPYEAWAAGPRERLRGRHLALLDLMVADAEARGDVDEALRLLERAADADPLDDERSLRVARLLLAQGRRGAAEGALRRAEAVLAGLGLPMGAALEALRREIAGTP
jgi:DNA-binding SARP family transcriptional activator